MPAVDVVSVYGAANAGVRARALSWCSHFGLLARLTSYFPRNTASATEFARHPIGALASEWHLRTLSRVPPDIVLLSREASPLSRGGVEAQLLNRAAHGVYDIDDALHEDLRGPAFEALFSKGAKATRAARTADVVIAGNDFLADWASAFNRDIRVIPTCVEPSNYAPKQNYDIGDPPRLVWLGTPSGEAYLIDIAAALTRVHQETGARLTLIGSGAQDLGPIEFMADRVPWSLPLVSQTLRDFDLGLMPLRNTPYEQGKCAYKLLEYGAAGLPFVGSPVGVNASILDSSGAPAPASIDEWVDALRTCLATSAEQRRIQACRQTQVISRYTFAHWASAWRDSVLGPHR